MEQPVGPAGGNESKSGGQERSGMLAVNDLNYVLAPDLAVSVNNTYKNHFFQSENYTNNQRGICILNSGADYGDTRHSTLNFIVKIASTVGTAGFFGKHGSALNVIRSLVISSRSGDEICRITDLNHLSAMQNGFRFSSNLVSTVGAGMGYGGVVQGTGAQHEQTQFSIPLYCLSDFFGYGRLMPAMVLAGMRIEIEWENPSIAFQHILTDTSGAPVANSITSYEIINPYISLRSVQLTDGTQRALNEMSAVNGLEIVYCDYERTESVLGSTNRLNVEVRKAASRALKSILSVREKQTSPSIVDSFATEEFNFTRWQWQLGSLYFPQQPVSAFGGESRLAIPESYQHTLNTFGTYKGDQSKTSAVPLRSNEDYLQATYTDTPVEYTTISIGTGTAWTIDTTGLLTVSGGTPALTALRTGDTLHVTIAGNKSLTFWATGTGTATTVTVSPIPEETVVATALLAYDGDGGGVDGENNTNHGTHYGGNNSYAQAYVPRHGLSANHEGKWGSFANGRSTISCLLERSDLFNLSGVPINNSRVLSAQCEFASNRDRVATIFLKYVKLARVFLNNVEVEQ